jgi:hypothetical protein
MIKIHCLETSDTNALGVYEYGQNMIYLGRKNTDFILNDLTWPENAMFFEVIEDQFYVHPQKSLEYFLINGKRCTGVKKIKRQDSITIGQTKIKLLDFSNSSFPTKKQVLDGKLGEIVQTNSPKLEMVRKLTEVMNQK